MEQNILKSIKTCDLVEELSRREGVEKLQIEPYKKVNIETEGPIVILKVID